MSPEEDVDFPPTTYLGQRGSWVLYGYRDEQGLHDTRHHWVQDRAYGDHLDRVVQEALRTSPALALACRESQLSTEGLKPELTVWCGVCAQRGKWRALARVFTVDGGSLLFEGRLAAEQSEAGWLQVRHLLDRGGTPSPLFVSCPNREVRLLLDELALVGYGKRRDVRHVVADPDPEQPQVACRLHPRRRGRHG